MRQNGTKHNLKRLAHRGTGGGNRSKHCFNCTVALTHVSLRRRKSQTYSEQSYSSAFASLLHPALQSHPTLSCWRLLCVSANNNWCWSVLISHSRSRGSCVVLSSGNPIQTAAHNPTPAWEKTTDSLLHPPIHSFLLHPSLHSFIHSFIPSSGLKQKTRQTEYSVRYFHSLLQRPFHPLNAQ
jgi:hypothetical protein